MARKGGRIGSVRASKGKDGEFMSLLGARPTGAVINFDGSQAESREPAPSNERQEQVTYVLVHGAWHGGWCWRDVRKQLRARGHDVYTPTLTGLGERAHLGNPDISIETHVADVLNVLNSEELTNVVLVGHSYAGIVITQAAYRAPERIRSLIYLDAILPGPGKSMLDQAPKEQIDFALSTIVDGYLVPAPDTSWFGIADSDEEIVDWMNRRLTPHPIATLLEPFILPGDNWPDLPKTYIRCVQPCLEFGIEKTLAGVKDLADWCWIELDAGHNAMMTAPEDVTEILLAAR